MKKLAAFAMMGVCAVQMTGCASIFNEKTQPINVSASNGKPFQGSVDGTPFSGPGIVTVYRQKNPKVFKVETAGCAPETTVDSGIDVKFWGNIVIGGVLGSSTDYSTDKMWKYSDSVVVNCNQ